LWVFSEQSMRDQDRNDAAECDCGSHNGCARRPGTVFAAIVDGWNVPVVG
jgi:hypothetical protein